MTRDNWHTGTSRYVMAGALAAGIAFTPYSIGLSGESLVMPSSAAAQMSGGGGGGPGGVGVGVGAEVGGVSASVGAEVGSGGASAGADVSAGGTGAEVGANVGGGDDGGGDDGGNGGNAGGGNAGGGGAGGDGGDDGNGGNGGDEADGETGGAGSAAGGAGAAESSTEAAAGTGDDEEDGGDRAARAGPDRGGPPGVRRIDRRHDPLASLDVRTPAFQRYSAAAERNNLLEAGDALWAATNRPVTPSLVTYVNEKLDIRTALTPDQIAAAANGIPGVRTTDSISSAAEQLTGSR